MELTRTFAGDRPVVLELRASRIREVGVREREREHGSPLAALVALHRRAIVLGREGALEDVAAGTGAVRHAGIVVELPLARSEVERRLGEALATRGAGALPDAVPLLFLEWPVGYRFGSLFEAHPRERAAKAAVAAAIARLDPRAAKGAGELLRVAGVQRNRDALAPALALLPHVPSFDAWMDVLELAYDVGDRRHAAAVRALARVRAPKDARAAARELAGELASRR